MAISPQTKTTWCVPRTNRPLLSQREFHYRAEAAASIVAVPATLAMSCKPTSFDYKRRGHRQSVVKMRHPRSADELNKRTQLLAAVRRAPRFRQVCIARHEFTQQKSCRPFLNALRAARRRCKPGGLFWMIDGKPLPISGARGHAKQTVSQNYRQLQGQKPKSPSRNFRFKRWRAATASRSDELG